MASEQIARIQHAHGKGAGDPGRLTVLAVLGHDPLHGLAGMGIDRAAGLGDGLDQGEVVVDDDLLQEQGADLLDRVGNGFDVMPFGEQAAAIKQRRLLRISPAFDQFAIDSDRDRQYADFVFFQKLPGQIASRIHDETEAHSPLPPATPPANSDRFVNRLTFFDEACY